MACISNRIMWFLLLRFLLLVWSAVSKPTTSEPTILTNYIGKWFQLYGDPSIYLFSGYGSAINTYDDRLSSKRLERATGYGYRKYRNTTTTPYYIAYLETIPRDGSYWLISLNNITTGYYKYSVLYHYSGSITIWGKETDQYAAPPSV